MRYKDLIGKLGIGESTLRRWCTLFEERGHVFSKDDSGRRTFSHADAEKLVQFQELCSSMRIEEALNILFGAQSQNLTVSIEALFDEIDRLLTGDWLAVKIYAAGPDSALQELKARWKELRAKMEAGNCAGKSDFENTI